MKRRATILGLLAIAALLVFFIARPRALAPGVLPSHSPDMVNGERLFHTGGCVSCHSSVKEDLAPPELGGGLAMESAYGVFRVPNISPDPVHGIGRWTMLDFVNAMKMGVSPGGRHYYPAFPYTSYSRMTYEDLMDLKSYLDTLPHVEAPNEDHEMKFPWNIRLGIGLWKLFNLDGDQVVPDLAEDPQLARGRYLVEGPGHCGECHTARDWTGGLDKSLWLAGAASPDGDGQVPNITASKSGLDGWSQSDIAYYLESGFTPDFDTVGGTMAKVQKNMARLPAEDREAIAAYLLAIPALD